ncbi:protein NDNF-like [Protopterus annectens]|uniref:protein NDNF-like n=1 Tax=Protopterus annectens TaxID=7888 RepID=UPI001CFA08D6|nr:protein NDNF-like [Protopterus annectens]
MEPMVTIFKYKGNDVETYVSNSPHTTLHRLELMSTEKDTSIKIYMTKHPKPGQLYPELPNDPRINIIGIGHTTVTVAWQPSPSALQYNSDIQYCLLINVKHNYKSLCAAEATLSTRVRMNDNKALSLFITTDLLKQSELILHSKVNNRMTSHAIHKESSWDVRHICIGTNTIYTIHSLLPNTQYYIDVFAINLLTNASAAYTGTFSKTLEEPIPSAKPLKDGEVALVNISGKGYQLYSFQSQGPNRRVQFTIQACAGDVWVQITRNGRRLVSEMVEDLRYFTLKGKPADTYIVHLQSMGTSRASTKVHVTSHFYRPLFPILPESLKIKSFNKLRTCDSITIAWLGTQERAKYCVYRKRLEKGHATKEIMNKDICSEPEARKKSEKVRCKTFHNLNLQRAVTTETIRGLESGTPYLFDVYLVGPTGIPIKYKSKVVSTRKEC